jgi:hypothetical protein
VYSAARTRGARPESDGGGQVICLTRQYRPCPFPIGDYERVCKSDVTRLVTGGSLRSCSRELCSIQLSRCRASLTEFGNHPTNVLAQQSLTWLRFYCQALLLNIPNSLAFIDVRCYKAEDTRPFCRTQVLSRRRGPGPPRRLSASGVYLDKAYANARRRRRLPQC